MTFCKRAQKLTAKFGGILECDGEPINGDVDAKAWVGKGSATVDEVRFIKGEALPVLEP